MCWQCCDAVLCALCTTPQCVQCSLPRRPGRRDVLPPLLLGDRRRLLNTVVIFEAWTATIVVQGCSPADLHRSDLNHLKPFTFSETFRMEYLSIDAFSGLPILDISSCIRWRYRKRSEMLQIEPLIAVETSPESMRRWNKELALCSPQKLTGDWEVSEFAFERPANCETPGVCRSGVVSVRPWLL